MATLLRKSGNTPGYEIRFFDTGGQTKSIYLGGKRYNEKTAQGLKDVVEALLFSRNNTLPTIDKRVELWIEMASPAIRKKLGKVGLIKLPPKHTLKELWDLFLAQKVGDIKKSTASSYEAVRKRFFQDFLENELLSDITKDRMQHWKNRLLDRGKLAKATVANTIKDVKAVFNWAKDQNWIEKSPLEGIGTGSFVNRENDQIVSMADYRRLLDACPCQDWRTIVALARIGGLRCPSEVVELRWEDVNWEHNKFFVRSSKTEHHEGKEGRWVPIFPELKEELEKLFFMPESVGKNFVINRYRDASQNLRTTFGKIVKRAGLEMFPRPFDNMRMTRSNEVYRKWGAFKESQWIGHSGRVRADHYLDMTDDDFHEAAGSKTSAQFSARGSQNESKRVKVQ